MTACVAAVAIVQRAQDNDSSAATPGLTATFSGKAFPAASSSGPPLMRVRGLRQGQATSGTVTVGNPGPGTRYFWLSPGRVSERLGTGGGRLSTAMALTVMDVTDISAPSIVYRGPLRDAGARPLGFLDRGARRSFSFVAELPTGGRSPAAPSVDPYRGAAADIGWTWHSLAGQPALPDRPALAGPAPARPTRDRRAPALTFAVPRRQRLLERRRLQLTIRCSEDCATRPRATMTAGGRTFSLRTAQAGRGLQGSHAVSVSFSASQAAALRSALLAGRVAKVRVAVEAVDRSGNRRRDSHAITLRPWR